MKDSKKTIHLDVGVPGCSKELRYAGSPHRRRHRLDGRLQARQQLGQVACVTYLCMPCGHFSTFVKPFLLCPGDMTSCSVNEIMQNSNVTIPGQYEVGHCNLLVWQIAKESTSQRSCLLGRRPRVGIYKTIRDIQIF